MLVKFKVENWKSFHCLDFSAIASSKRRFNERVPKVKNYRTVRLLPISAVFGGNASGKTNFFDALVFLQKLVRGKGVVGEKFDVKPFAFNKDDRKKPVSFEVEFLVESRIYHYELVVSYDKVHTERLAEVCKKGNLKFLFERDTDSILIPDEFKSSRLKCVREGTRDNVLFLTNSVQQRCDEFRSVYNWFDKTLLLIPPHSKIFRSFRLLQPKCRELLESFDVGFDELAKVDMTLEQIIQDMQEHNIPKELQERFREQFESAVTNVLDNRGEPAKLSKIVAIHSSEDGLEKIPFELEEESDGTRRLLNLLPALVRLRDSSQSSVVFIDELDRSMHHLLTKKLIEAYLDECSPESRTQLFFTTHDALLLDEDLLRRDEMWLVDREEGVSELMSIADYKIHKGQNLLFSYLYGRFGGIPHIH